MFLRNLKRHGSSLKPTLLEFAIARELCCEIDTYDLVRLKRELADGEQASYEVLIVELNRLYPYLPAKLQREADLRLHRRFSHPNHLTTT